MAEALDPILPGRVDALATQVLNEACMRGLMLAAAESCTGGLLASLLTDVPGCSHAFERGFVTYTNEAKHEMLGLSLALLEDPGPVSEEAARAMAEGALAASRAHIALSVTGWTEEDPGRPDPDRPAGRVWLACARRGRGANLRRLELGDIGRAAIRIACLEAALELMLQALEG
jgi:nicotinamide-nucleotide amidase